MEDPAAAALVSAVRSISPAQLAAIAGTGTLTREQMIGIGEAWRSLQSAKGPPGDAAPADAPRSEVDGGVPAVEVAKTSCPEAEVPRKPSGGGRRVAARAMVPR